MDTGFVTCAKLDEYGVYKPGKVKYNFSNIGKVIVPKRIYFCSGDEKEINYRRRLQAAGKPCRHVHSGAPRS